MTEPLTGPKSTLRRADEVVPLDVEEAIAACGGDTGATVRALLVMIDHLRAELAARDGEIAALAASVSRGYARGLGERHLPGLRALPRLDDKALRKPED
ncbi:hypothetical protein [Labrys neptuniae]